MDEGKREKGQREGWKDRKYDRRDADENSRGVGGGVGGWGGALS